MANDLLVFVAWPIMAQRAFRVRGDCEDKVAIADIGSRPVRGKAGRPLIGLVLGSGAARGFAHIGVIRALIDHGIVPDIIVGTSMGALVGGCYANDKLDQLEAWARSLTLRRIIGYLDVRIGGS
ncbi:MAG TPA: patatin-like phospholipase family protein, partial [Xanthobacteraceae bacterium]|nr:patatin-like phospholipase family protein [Xanthobacteraceae bacterium]